MNELTLSVVSHGHGPMIGQLLADLDRLPSLAGARLFLTLNIPEDTAHFPACRSIDVVVRSNAAPQGFGHNHNNRFAECRSRWFVVLNPDLRIHDDPFPALLAALSDDPALALVAPSVFNSSGQAEDSVRTNLTPWSLLRRRIGFPDQQEPAHRASPSFYWVAGMFMLIEASVYRHIGGFDPRFFLYCEDYDLCARIALAGRRIGVVSAARVVHDAQRDSHRRTKHLRWHLASLARVWLSTAYWRITLRNACRRG